MRMAHDLYYVYLSSLEGSLACRRAELLLYTNIVIQVKCQENSHKLYD